tara:strand:- start:537 stop:668 length:132 start_codon:yes stop_codon:yes gene_type:complete
MYEKDNLIIIKITTSTSRRFAGAYRMIASGEKYCKEKMKYDKK